MTKYDSWIKKHYSTYHLAYLKCKEATAKMVKAFPELRQVRGYVLVGMQRRPHWWCETEEGIVIDPTKVQYKVVPSIYEEVSGEEPHGTCLNCGEFLFKSREDSSNYCCDCSLK